MTYAISEAAAVEEAKRRNDALGTPTQRWVVDRYPDGQIPREQWSYGVRHEYKYADRPEFGWINGGFVWF